MNVFEAMYDEDDFKRDHIVVHVEQTNTFAEHCVYHLASFVSRSNAFYVSLTLTLVTSLLKVTLLFSLTLFAFSSI